MLKSQYKSNKMKKSASHELLGCCFGGIFSKKIPLSSECVVAGEKPRLPMDTNSTDAEIKISSTPGAISEDPPPCYSQSCAGNIDVINCEFRVPLDTAERNAVNMQKSNPKSYEVGQQGHRNEKPDYYDRSQIHVVDYQTNTVYRQGKLLGKGGFARCYELIDTETNKVYAGKIISKSRLTKPRQKEKIIREIDLHSSLYHPNVVQFHTSFEDDLNFYIILENCSKKSLVHMLKARKTLTESEVRYYLRQLVEGCRYVHSQKIIHRDLKLGNMLLNENMQVKIADFGLATRVEYTGEKKMTVCGTPNYIAPEVLQKKGHSYEADIWAIGCIMYALLCGRPPFETASLKETYLRIAANRFQIPNHVSPAARDLMYRLLHPEPMSRPKLETILSDEFFSSGFNPDFLPTSCCEMEPKFPAFKKAVRTKSFTDQQTNNKENVKVQEKRQEDGQRPRPTRRSSSQRQGRVSNENEFAAKQKLPFRSETFSVPPQSYASPKELPEKPLYRKPSNLDSCKKPVYSRKVLREVPIPEKNEDGFNFRLSKPNRNETKLQYKDMIGFNPSSTKEPAVFTKDRFSVEKQMGLYKMWKEKNDLCVYSQEPSGGRACSPSSCFSDEIGVSSSSAIRLYRALTQCIDVMPPDSYPTTVPNCKPLWVTKWVDYSNKYGFGFQLSDGSVGILFNDTTRMVLSTDKKTLTYNDLSNKTSTFTTDSAPSEQRKKVTLLLYFNQYMDEHLIQGGDVAAAKDRAALFHVNNVFMKKWFRTDKAIVMHLNNGTLQVNFFDDHTKLILSVDGQDYLVTYIDSDRQPVSYRLLSLTHFGCSDQIAERLRYARRMLESVINLGGETV